jgi:hypothetical protein
MVIERKYKNPGDLIRSEEWNQILDELIDLRKHIDEMSSRDTLTSLESPTGTSCGLGTNAPQDLNYDTEVMGQITKQYYVGGAEVGEICKFGINNFADIIYYWSAATVGGDDVLKVTLEYTDGSTFTSDKLFIHSWSELSRKGDKNPYVEYLLSPNRRVWYKYALQNPHPDNEIRSITFEDVSANSGARIANVVQYVARVMSLQVAMKGRPDLLK